MVGHLENGSLENSYSIALVTGTGTSTVYVGGLVGTVNTDGSVSSCAALNPRVAGSYARRVVGNKGGGTTALLSNNLAFSNMLNSSGTNVWNDKGPGALDGEDITADVIYALPAMGGRFSDPPWVTGAGKLPGFGQAHDMPDYINGDPTVTRITISPTTVYKLLGETQAFTITVTGLNSPPATATWSVTGGGAGTSVSADGVLTIAPNETAATLTVTAVSTIDNTKSVTATVYAVPPMAGEGTIENPYIITEASQSGFIASTTGFGGKHYRLGKSINLSGKVWVPIGLSGTFDGNYNIISGLSGSNGVFSNVSGTVKNLGAVDVNIDGGGYVGGIAGQIRGNATISNCYTTGTISGSGTSIGGIVGRAEFDIYSSSSGQPEYYGGSILNCYSTATVIGGGSGSYGYAGGIVGSVANNTSGSLGKKLTITNCYAAEGSISGRSEAGGLVGAGENNIKLDTVITVTDSYWDVETTGRISSAGGGTVKTTAAMKTQSSYAGWDFSAVWAIDPGKNDGYPTLRGFPDSPPPAAVAFRPNSAQSRSAMPQISVRGRTLTVKHQSSSAPLHLRVIDLRGRTVSSFSAAKGDAGVFSLAKIPAGRYLVEVRRSGVRSGTTAVLVR
jgi:hypothetical protein